LRPLKGGEEKKKKKKKSESEVRRIFPRVSEFRVQGLADLRINTCACLQDGEKKKKKKKSSEEGEEKKKKKKKEKDSISDQLAQLKLQDVGLRFDSFFCLVASYAKLTAKSLNLRDALASIPAGLGATEEIQQAVDKAIEANKLPSSDRTVLVWQYCVAPAPSRTTIEKHAEVLKYVVLSRALRKNRHFHSSLTSANLLLALIQMVFRSYGRRLAFAGMRRRLVGRGQDSAQSRSSFVKVSL